MADLQTRLTQLAAQARWPPTPPLAGQVRAALDAAPATSAGARRRRSARRRRPLLAALLALVVGGGVLAAPGVGSGLLERLGLRTATITRVDRLPPAGLGGPLALGDRYSLADARRLAGFELRAPAALGAPAEVYVDDGAVAFVYRARSGRPLLFTQLRGSMRPYIQKLVAADTRRVRIDGSPAVLVRGEHVVIFDGADGRTHVERSRLAKNTLLWERGGVLLRLEGEQPLGELVRIARSLR